MHSWQILPVFPENCSAQGDSIYTHTSISFPSHSASWSDFYWFLHCLVGFTSVGSLALKQYNESVSRLWFRQGETPTLSSKKFCQHISSSPFEAWGLFCLHLNCKIPTINLAAWGICFQWKQEKGFLCFCLWTRPHGGVLAGEGHPFIIQILQIIYLIRKDSSQTPYVLTGTVAEFFSYFSQ